MENLFLMLKDYVPFFMVVILAVSTIIRFSTKRKARASKSWPATKGKINTSEVKRIKISENDSTRFKYEPQISYQYNIDDKEYSGHQIHFMDDDFEYGGKQNVEKIIEKYAPGTEAVIFYNPKDHRETVLETEFKTSGSFIGILAMLLVSVICLIIQIVAQFR